MAFTPFVQTDMSLFSSDLVFDSVDDARTSAESMESRLKSLHLRIVKVGTNETDHPANHVLRDGRLVRIEWPSTPSL